MYNVGAKYYKFIKEDEYSVIRLLRIKNTDTYVFLDENDVRIKLTKEQAKEYTKITPDGHVSFSIVEMKDSLSDVVVSMFRKKDLDEGNQIPYAICRQNVFDIFSNQFGVQNGMNNVGCSVSVDTCPKNIEYRMFMACEGISENVTVDIYMDDNIEDILKYISAVNYDVVLYDLFRKMTIVASGTGTQYEGYCANLKALLNFNNFRHDILKGFDIEPILWDIAKTSLANNVIMLEDIVKKQILNPVISIFDKGIEMDKISRSYKLLKDITNTLYIIVYTEGEYINRSYDALEDKSDMQAMLNNAQLNNH